MSTESDIDIIYIDNKILSNFKKEKDNIENYKDKLKDVKYSLTLNNLRPNIKDILTRTHNDLEEYIDDLENDKSLNFYIIDSVDLLEKYKDILNKPVKINFLGKVTKNNKDKKHIIDKYIEIASKYVDIEINNNEKKDKISCKHCNNKEFDIEDGNICICVNCSAQEYIIKNISSYKDIDRINVSSKYMYDRKIHFRDQINQYQGKQNSTVSQKVYDDLEKQFELHHLLVGDKNTSKIEKFKNITKEHIAIFLKELGYSKHYENINLIHYNITGIKPDDIGYLEDKLLEDFDILTEVYDKTFKHIDRKNFINTQFCLYQLLIKHKHPCKKEDFSILKTIDRLNFHNEVCAKLFEMCNWTFTNF